VSPLDIPRSARTQDRSNEEAALAVWRKDENLTAIRMGGKFSFRCAGLESELTNSSSQSDLTIAQIYDSFGKSIDQKMDHDIFQYLRCCSSPAG
jgi:hypothetical protein